MHFLFSLNSKAQDLIFLISQGYCQIMDIIIPLYKKKSVA